MQRNLRELGSREFDLLIVGAGIHGAAAAWDAVLRGLSVAVVDQGDFVSGNSSNSLKIVHGGLRYLQQADFARMRASIRERTTMLKIAPHLVQPLDCLLPTYGLGTKSKPALRIALAINDLMSRGCNKPLSDPGQHVSKGRIISREDCLSMLPGLDERGVTGAALWQDAQMFNSERLALSFILSAAREGAVAANYAAVSKLLLDGDKITGAVIEDQVSGESFEVRAKSVLICAGAAADKLLALTGKDFKKQYFAPSTAMNLVFSKKLFADYAAGLRQRYSREGSGGKIYKGSRVFFFTPWRERMVIGTRHLPLGSDPLADKVTEDKIEAFLAEINQAYPGGDFKRSDVLYWHWGIIPMDGIDQRSGEVNLTRHSKIIDHAADGIRNLVSVIGVKYTTGRAVAEQGIGLILRKLGHKNVPSQSSKRALTGGEFDSLDSLEGEISDHKPAVPSDHVIKHLAKNYGSDYRKIFELGNENAEWLKLLPGSNEVMAAEVIHAAREEMAVKLTDVILRRTDLGSAGPPDDVTLQACARLMAKEMGWSQSRTADETETVKKVYKTSR